MKFVERAPITAFLFAALLSFSPPTFAQIAETFAPQPDGEVFALAVQPDGNILAGGDFTILGGFGRHSLSRLLPGGELDWPFDAAIRPDLVSGDDVACLAIRPGGTILVGGQFQALGGVDQRFLARLQPTGALDSAFDRRPADAAVWALALQADGKFLVAGADPSARLRRYEGNGWADSAFSPTANDEIRCVAVQADGRILVGGRFTTLNGQPRRYVGRLLTNGALDDAFNLNADGEVRTLVVQPDGRILAGGDFSSIGGQSQARLARIEPDGAVESGFNVGPGANGRVETLALQADGRIIVGGAFSQFDGQIREGIARLLSDGSLDSSFDPAGTLATVHALALQPNGKLLVGGLVFQLMGWSYGNLARLEGLGEATQSLTVNGTTVTWLRGGTSPEVWTTSLEWSIDAVNWTSLGAGERIPGGWQWISPSLPPIANVRARGWLTGGQGNGSAWFVEAVAGSAPTPPVISRQPASQARCQGAGQTVTFSVIAGGNGPFTYQWRKDRVDLSDSPDFQGVTTDTLQVSRLRAELDGTYDVVVRNASGSVTSASANLAIGGEPDFVTQPVHITKNPGETATFEVSLTGTQPMTYQWRRDGVPISGQNGATLTLANLQCSENSVFDVIVANTCGRATSAAATLTVRGAPIILTQPANGIRKPGESITFKVLADGAPALNFQWRKGGVPLAGQTGAALTLANLQSSDRGWFDVVVENHCGSATSAKANLVVVQEGWSGPTLLGQWPGGPRGRAVDVEVFGNLAYIAAEYGGLMIVDVTDVRNPVQVGQYDGARVSSVQLVGSVAYAAGGTSGLEIIDVSDPVNPVRMGGYSTGGSVGKVKVKGNLAYVTEWEAGLQIIDVSDPANPVRVGGFDTSGIALGLEVAGNLVYVADKDAGLQIIDVSNPANPVRVGGYDSGNDAEMVQLVGNLAYLVDGFDGLQIIDVSNPASPVRVGRYSKSGGATSVQVVGNLAYVTYAYDGLKILDVSNPANPVLVRDYPESNALGVEVVGGTLAFVADSDAGLLVLSLKGPGGPSFLGNHLTGGTASRVQVAGNLAYLADGNAGLQVFDVSNPANPVRVGGHNTLGNTRNDNPYWYAQDVHLSANLAYVAAWEGGLQIFDVSHPANPVRVGGYLSPESGVARSVQVVGSLAYLSVGQAGMQIIDVSDPAFPVRVGKFITSGSAFHVQVLENLAYVADWDGGLQIIDISHPANPVRIGGWNDLWSIRAGFVQVVGSLAYLATEGGGLQIIDVRDPTHPVHLGHDTAGYVYGFAVAESLAFVAKGFSTGLDLIDVSDPTRPIRLGGIETKGGALGVQVVGNVVYVADGSRGLTVLQLFDDRPIIKAPPLSQDRNLGESVTFTVTTAGTPATSFQWRKDGVTLPGETGASLTLRDLQFNSAGQYDVVVANSYGSVTSAPAALNMLNRLTIANQPSPAALWRRVGENVTLAVTATATQPLTYQWRKDGAPLVGATETTLMLPALRPADSGTYDVVVASPVDSVTSSTVALRVTEIAPDESYRGSSVRDGALVENMAVQPDGKVLAWGTAVLHGVHLPPALFRLTTEGHLDPDFRMRQRPGLVSFYLQADGKILARTTNRFLYRWNGDGTTDANFKPCGGPHPNDADPEASGSHWEFSEQCAGGADGNSLVSIETSAWETLYSRTDGSLVYYGGPRSRFLVRLRDRGLEIEAGTDRYQELVLHEEHDRQGFPAGVRALACQPDGGVLMGYGPWLTGGRPPRLMARFGAQGTFDASFAPILSGGDALDRIMIQPDGKILIAGNFETIDGQPRRFLGRLQPHGALDPSFLPQVDGPIQALLLQTDGKILLQGTFQTVAGQPRPSLARLHPDGTLDDRFDPDIDGTVDAIALQADGKLVVSGQFATVSGQQRLGLARLLNSDPATDHLSFTPETITWFRGGSSPEVWRTTFEVSTDGVNWTPLGVGTRIAGGWQLTGQSLARATRVRARGFVVNGGRTESIVESYAGAPTIPAATRFVFPELNTPLTLTARAEGSGTLTFQWFKGGQPLTDGGNLDGATSANLNIHETTDADAGEYSVAVGNAQGTITVPVATVAFSPPRILHQPTSTNVVTNRSATFEVVVEGTPPLTYRWRKDGIEIAKATDSSFSIPKAVLQDAGQYDVTIENHQGTVVSEPAQLAVRLANSGAIAFARARIEADENAGTVILAVERQGGSDGPVSVDCRLLPESSANEGQDFTTSSATLNWADGETGTQTVRVDILDDTATEIAETIRLELANPSGGAILGAPGQATLTIADNDTVRPPPTLGIRLKTDGAITLEWNAGDAPRLVTSPTVDGPWTIVTEAVSPYQTPASAAAGFFRIVDGTQSSEVAGFVNLAFRRGVALLIQNPLESGANDLQSLLPKPSAGTKVFSVENGKYWHAVFGSVVDEVWDVNLAGLSPGHGFGLLSPAAAIHTFVGKVVPNASPTLLPGLNWVGSPIPRAGGVMTDLHFPIVDGDVIHQWDANAQTFRPANHYSALTGWSQGEPRLEVGEAIVVQRGVDLPPPSLPWTTTDLFELTLATEPAAGGTIQRAPTPGLNGRYDYEETIHLTAVPAPGYAFDRWSDVFTYDGGQPSGHFHDATRPDAQIQIRGHITVTAHFAPVEPGTIAFSQAEWSVEESGGSATITAIRTGGSDGPVSVDYQMVPGGTATEGQDFGFASGTLTWRDGDTVTKSFSVGILDDGVFEVPETIRLELSNPTGGASLRTPTQATLVIADNDTIARHRLTLTAIPADAGTIQASPPPGGDGNYAHGTVVTLNAAAAAGAVFLRWESALTGHDPSATITVTEALAIRAVFSRPFGGVAHAVPGLIEAEDFDEGGEGIGYHDADAVNHGGSPYRIGGVDILREAPIQRIGWSNDGEWLNYTVNVPAAGFYRAVLRVSSGQSGGTGRLRFLDGSTTGLIRAPGTGAWNSYVAVTSAPFALTAATQVIRFEFVQSGFDLEGLRFQGGTFKPQGAASLAGSGEVGVRFGRLLEAASATRVANYSVSGAVVTGAILAPDGSGALLKTSGLTGSAFTVRVSGVRDTLGNLVTDSADIVGQVLTQRRQDVGLPGDPVVRGTSFSSRAGDFDVRAGGTDIWNTQDGFHFIHQQITGDFDVRVRVESLEPVNRWSKASLVARESLAPDSRNLAVGVEPPAVPTRDGQFGGVGADTYFAQGRMTRGGATILWTRDAAALTGPPYPNGWLRLQRQGAVFRAYRGSDGARWTLIGETTQNLPSTLYVGLGTTSHNNAPGYAALARYREYQRTGVAAPRITSEPGDLEVFSGGPATFAVAATGAEPLQYQWQFNGSNLDAAAGPTITLGSASEASAGAYRVIVVNEAGLAVSRGATLSVADTSPPSLRFRKVDGSFALAFAGAPGTRFQVLFSSDLVHWQVFTEVASDGGPIELPIPSPDPRGAFFQVRTVRR